MNNAAKILIVEDEVLIAEYLQNILKSNGYHHTKIVHTEAEAYEKINSFSPNIILLDINLEGNNEGIVVAQNIASSIPIIFLTAQNDLATIEKAINLKPESYLTKPIKIPDLLAAVQLASLKQPKPFVTVKIGYDTIKIYQEHILYIKSDNNYIDVFTTTKKHTLRTSLDQFLSKLNSDIFCKIHRSYIVNKTKVTKKKALRH